MWRGPLIIDATSDREIVEHLIAEGFALDFSPDGASVVLAGDIELVVLSATELDERTMSFEDAGGICAMKCLPNGEIAATGTPEGGVQGVWLWHLR